MRSQILCALLTAGVVGAGCAKVIPGDHYTVYVDPTFTDSERAAIIDGLQDWTSKVPVSFDVFIQACNGFDNGVICTHRSDTADVIAHHGRNCFGVTQAQVGSGTRGDSGGVDGKDGGEVWIDMQMVAGAQASHPTILSQTFNHEVGHAMGLVHHTTYALMYPSLKPEGSTTVTCDDVGQWFYVRFRPVFPCTIPQEM